MLLALGAAPKGDAVLVVDPKVGVVVVVAVLGVPPKLNLGADVVPVVGRVVALLTGSAAGAAVAAGFPNENTPPVAAAGCCVSAGFASPALLEPPKKLNLGAVEAAVEAGAAAAG